MKKHGKSRYAIYFMVGMCLLFVGAFFVIKKFRHIELALPVKQPHIQAGIVSPGQPETAQIVEPVSDIVVGSILDLTGGVMELHKSLYRGAEMCFKEVNQTKELKNKRFIFKYYDYKYDQLLAKHYTKKFFEKEKIALFLAPGGTIGVQAMADVLRDKDAAILFPRTGASALRRSDYRHVVLLLTSYTREGQALVAHAFKKLFAKKIAFFYQNDNFGKSLLEGALKELQKNKILDDHYILVPYPTNTTNLGDAGTRIKAFNPDAIILFSVPAATMMLINQGDSSWFASKFLLGASSLTNKHFLQTLKQRHIHIRLSHVIPSFMQPDLEIAQEFNKLAQKYDIEKDDYCFEGYIAARLFVDAVKAIGDPVTPSRVIDYFVQMKNVLWKGLQFNFNQQTRELSDYVWISEDI